MLAKGGRRIAGKRLLAGLVLSILAALPAGAGPAGERLILTNVMVLPMTGSGPLPNHAVIVDGQVIVAVMPMTDLAGSEPGTRIDGAGRWLLPGFGDMHVHVPGPGRPALREDFLAMLVAKGVTVARGMWGGRDELALRQAIDDEERLAPALVLAGPGFGAWKGTPAEAAAEVGRQHAAGWDLIKVHWGPSAAVYDAVAASAKRLGMEFSGHVPRAVDVTRVLAAGQRTIEHLDGFLRAADGLGARLDDAALLRLAREVRDAGTIMVPTLFAWEVYLRHLDLETLDTMDELAYVPPEILETWRRRHPLSLAARAEAVARSWLGDEDLDIVIQNRRRLLQAMDRAGVEIMLGSDTMQPFVVPGFSILREMRAMVAAGLSSRRALEAATAAVGRYLGDHARLGRLGVIAEGARADMVLFRGDPTIDLSVLDEPEGVVLRGRWIPGQVLAARLADIRRRHAGQR